MKKCDTKKTINLGMLKGYSVAAYDLHKTQRVRVAVRVFQHKIVAIRWELTQWPRQLCATAYPPRTLCAAE